MNASPVAPAIRSRSRKRRNLIHICRKLRLEPRMRLLDLGCGWGGLAIHAASEYGVQVTGVTLSQRDAEVQLGMVDELLPQFPELRSFRRRLRRRIDCATERAQRRLHRGRRKLSRCVRAFVAMLDEPPRVRDPELAMSRAVKTLAGDVRDLRTKASCDETQLHRARVALKRMRYIAEALREVLPGAGNAWLDALRNAQHVMGDIHDHDVLAGTLKDYVAGRSRERRQLRRLQVEIETRRQKLQGELVSLVLPMPARLQRALNR